MKTIQLNIGLSTPSGAIIEDATVYASLAGFGINPSNQDVTFGDCEQGKEAVLCLTVEVPDIQAFKREIYSLAFQLKQDCIAIAYDHEHGELIGPRPYAGGFDPEFFQFLEWPVESHLEVARAALEEISLAGEQSSTNIHEIKELARFAWLETAQ